MAALGNQRLTAVMVTASVEAREGTRLPVILEKFRAVTVEMTLSKLLAASASRDDS